MKYTLKEFLEVAANAGIVITSELIEGGYWMYTAEHDYIVSVNDTLVTGSIELFEEGCDDIYDANTIRIITFDDDDGGCVTFASDATLEFEVYKKVVL